LAKVQCCQEDRVAGEDNRHTRHIDTQTQSTRSDDNTKVSFPEQHLDTLAILPIHTRMMNSNATLQELNQTILDRLPTQLPYKYIEFGFCAALLICETKIILWLIRVEEVE
jgi:hypothetical protein